MADPAQTVRQLRYLFGGLERHPEYKNGRIEVTNGKEARFFKLTELDRVAKAVAIWTRDGKKSYFNAGLIRPDYEKVRRFDAGEPVGHSSAEGILCRPLIWFECDHKHLAIDAGDVEAIGLDACRNHALHQVAKNHGFAWGMVIATGTVPSLRMQAFKRLAEPASPDDLTFWKVQKSIVANGRGDTAATNSSQLLRLAGSFSFAKPGEVKEAEAGLPPRITEPVVIRNPPEPRNAARPLDLAETFAMMGRKGLIRDVEAPAAKLDHAKSVEALLAKIKCPDNAPDLDRDEVRGFVGALVRKLSTTDAGRRDALMKTSRTVGGLLWTGAFELDELLHDVPADEDGPGLSLVLAHEMNGAAADYPAPAEGGILDGLATGAGQPLTEVPKIATGTGFGAVDDEAEAVSVEAAARTFLDVVDDLGDDWTTDDLDTALAALQDALKTAGASDIATEALLTSATAVLASLAIDEEVVAQDLATFRTRVATFCGSHVNEAPIGLKSLEQFVAEYVPLRYLVKSTIAAGYAYTLTGKAGDGKTTFLIALSLALATGRRDILGVEVERSRVVYATFENADDFRAKLIAAMTFHRVTFADVGNRLVIRDAHANPEKMAKLVKANGPTDLVVVDTLQAAFQGDDSNDNDAVKKFIQSLRKLSRLPGKPTVLIAAHPVKRAGNDDLVPYGGGSIINEIDGNFTFAKRGDLCTWHWQRKIRGRNFDPIGFRIVEEKKPGVLDWRGEQIPLPVLKPAGADEVLKAKSEVAKEETVATRVLIAFSETPEATMQDVAERIQANKASVSKAVKGLADKGWFEQHGRGWRITEAGIKAAAESKATRDRFAVVDDEEDDEI